MKLVRHIPVLVVSSVFLIFVGCGGGSDPPPYEPTDEQKAALENLDKAFADLQNDLLNGDKCESGQYRDVAGAPSTYDNIMNVVMPYVTANNGMAANQPNSMAYLTWYIQNNFRQFANNNAQQFQSLPLDEQGNILACAQSALGQIPGGADPSLQNLIANATSFLGGLPGGAPIGGNPFAGPPGGNPFGGAPGGNPFAGNPGGNPFGGAPGGNPFGGPVTGGPLPLAPTTGNPFGGTQLAGTPNPFGNGGLNFGAGPSSGANPFNTSSTGNPFSNDFFNTTNGAGIIPSNELVNLNNPF